MRYYLNYSGTTFLSTENQAVKIKMTFAISYCGNCAPICVAPLTA